MNISRFGFGERQSICEAYMKVVREAEEEGIKQNDTSASEDMLKKMEDQGTVDTEDDEKKEGDKDTVKDEPKDEPKSTSKKTEMFKLPSETVTKDDDGGTLTVKNDDSGMTTVSFKEEDKDSVVPSKKDDSMKTTDGKDITVDGSKEDSGKNESPRKSDPLEMMTLENPAYQRVKDIVYDANAYNHMIQQADPAAAAAYDASGDRTPYGQYVGGLDAKVGNRYITGDSDTDRELAKAVRNPMPYLSAAGQKALASGEVDMQDVMKNPYKYLSPEGMAIVRKAYQNHTDGTAAKDTDSAGGFESHVN